MKVKSSWILGSGLALIAAGIAFGGGGIKSDGNIETDGQFVSNEPTLPPLQVFSSALVTGLNAEFLGGLDSSAFAGAVHAHDDLYFTETELSVSFGGAVVHWDNVTSVPADLADGDDMFTPADPPCFDNSNRHVDCRNGTVTDTVTGLIWLQDANCFGRQSYATANNSAASLADGVCGLTDNSSPGDWRLPTKAEWEATVARAVALGCTGASAPSLTDTEGTRCFVSGNQPFSGVQPYGYASSSAREHYPGLRWWVYLYDGSTRFDPKRTEKDVWPGRGGP